MTNFTLNGDKLNHHMFNIIFFSTNNNFKNAMTLRKNPFWYILKFFHFGDSLYSCPYIAKSANIAEKDQYGRFFLEKNCRGYCRCIYRFYCGIQQRAECTFRYFCDRSQTDEAHILTYF